MNKKDIATIVARDSNLSLREASALVSSVFDAVKEVLAEEGDRVTISGFGSFKSYIVPPRKVNSPHSSKPTMAAKTSKILFTPSQQLKDEISENDKAPVKAAVKKKKG